VDKRLKLLAIDCIDEEGTGTTTELSYVADSDWSVVDEDGEEKVKVLGPGREEGPALREGVFVIATGSPSENTADDASKLLLSR